MWFTRRSQRTRDELSFHRDRLIEEFVAAGMDRRTAERRAFLEFGNVALLEEASKDVRGRWWEDLRRDSGYAIRTLQRSPGFAAVAVLSLALGIGATTGIFSLVNAVMLRPLPVTDPDGLVQIARVSNGRPVQVSYPLFEYFRDNVMSTAGAFAQNTSAHSIVIDGDDELVIADLVSGEYFTVLGLKPAAGRLLSPVDDIVATTSPAAVISDRYWERRFGRSPSAIGRTFTIRDRVFTIVGVTPPSFRSVRLGSVPDVTLPLALMTTDQQRRSMDSNTLSMIARLRPGATVDQVNSEVQVLWNALIHSRAAEGPEKERPGILRQRAAAVPAPGGVNQFHELSEPLLLLLAIVGLILLLGCVNLAGLLLARAAARQREIAIRLAIGAGRARLVQQFLTESLVLSAMGGVFGLAIAVVLSHRLALLFISGRPVQLSVAPDWRVFGFNLAASLAACILAGLVPAVQAARGNLGPAFKEVRASGQHRLGKVLVGAQMAMSMVLVIAATLFVGTLVNLYGTDRGFQSDGVLVVQLRTIRTFEADRSQQNQNLLVSRMRAMPGALSASAAGALPIGGGDWTRTVTVEGSSAGPDASGSVAFNTIAPAYFATMGTPLLAGREFNERDTATSTKVAIVNESLARYFFGNASALGRHVTSAKISYEIVGVVGDAKYVSLRESPRKAMYIPWTLSDGETVTSYTYLVRALDDPSVLTPAIERLVRETDPALRVRAATTYAAVIDRSVVPELILATLAGLLGVLALVIAGIGMFGMLAFQVARRTNELGVRLALGAARLAIIRLVLRDVALTLAPGMVVGVGVAYLAAGLTRSIVFGFAPTDPLVFVTAASVLGAAALLAALLPARRASRIDPVFALRQE
jgi:predicted permease